MCSCVSYVETGFGEENNLIANNMCVYVHVCSYLLYWETGLGEENNLIPKIVCVCMCMRFHGCHISKLVKKKKII